MSCGSLSSLLVAPSWRYLVGLQACFVCSFSSSFLQGGGRSELRKQISLYSHCLITYRQGSCKNCCVCSRRVALKLQPCFVHNEASFISISLRCPSYTFLVELPRGAPALLPITAWLTGRVAHWSRASLVACLTGRVTHWSRDSLVAWLTGRVTHWSRGSLVA